MLGGGCKRFGVDWLCVGQTMRVYCFDQGASSQLDEVFGRFLLHAQKAEQEGCNKHRKAMSVHVPIYVRSCIFNVVVSHADVITFLLITQHRTF